MWPRHLARTHEQRLSGIKPAAAACSLLHVPCLQVRGGEDVPFLFSIKSLDVKGTWDNMTGAFNVPACEWEWYGACLPCSPGDSAAAASAAVPKQYVCYPPPPSLRLALPSKRRPRVKLHGPQGPRRLHRLRLQRGLPGVAGPGRRPPRHDAPERQDGREPQG